MKWIVLGTIAAGIVAVLYAPLMLASRRDDQMDEWLRRYREGGGS